jgi:hypothetical protein
MSFGIENSTLGTQNAKQPPNLKPIWVTIKIKGYGY